MNRSDIQKVSSGSRRKIFNKKLIIYREIVLFGNSALQNIFNDIGSRYFLMIKDAKTGSQRSWMINLAAMDENHMICLISGSMLHEQVDYGRIQLDHYVFNQSCIHSKIFLVDRISKST